MADPYLLPPAQRQSPLATLKPGPDPTGYDRVFDTVYGWLGGTPDKRSTASALASLFDVATLGMATGAYDAVQEVGKGNVGLAAAGMMPGAKVAAPAVKAAESAVQKGIRGFHGSPHDFDRFDLSKIGTGNGYAAFGQGVNLSSTEAPARKYGKHMYEVKVNAPEETFLNWDAPIAEQSPVIKKAAQELLPGQNVDDLTGQAVAVMSGPFAEMRERLMARGVNGVTHDMRGGQGRVVFDDQLIEILRKYGLLPPAAGAGAMATSQGGDDGAF